LAISIGGDLWKNESHEYPEVIIDSIKDNATILGLFSHGKGDPWTLDWLQPYLESIWNEAAFANCLAKAFVFLGEELQHASYSTEAHVQASSTLFQVGPSGMVLPRRLKFQLWYLKDIGCIAC
jgi:ATP-dependent RNA/DNA helicase, senataxin